MLLYMEQTVILWLVQVQTVIVYIRRAVDNVAVYETDCYYMTGPSADINCVH